MLDKISNYLIVNTKDITKTIYAHERVFIANDGCNIYSMQGAIDVSEIFKKNNVPEKFQIIIIDLNQLYGTQHFIKQKNKAKEFFTEKELNLFYKKKNNNIYIIGINDAVGEPMDSYYAPQNEFTTIPTYASYKTVLAFIKELKKSGCYEAYRKSIVEALGLDVRVINHNKKLNKLKRL